MQTRTCAKSGHQPHFIEPDRATNPRVKYCQNCTYEYRNYESRAEYLRQRQAEFIKRNPGYSTKYVRKHRAKKRAESCENENQF